MANGGRKAVLPPRFPAPPLLIPADGFYEWLGDVPGKEDPFSSIAPTTGFFAFRRIVGAMDVAGWSEIETGVIVTTAPNARFAEIHDRMPVVIQPQDYETWLTGDR